MALEWAERPLAPVNMVDVMDMVFSFLGWGRSVEGVQSVTA